MRGDYFGAGHYFDRSYDYDCGCVDADSNWDSENGSGFSDDDDTHPDHYCSGTSYYCVVLLLLDCGSDYGCGCFPVAPTVDRCS
jgi:hypothetical protein